MTAQLITPNPHIPCTPGWCLQYVREAFGIYPGVYPSATAGWNASPTKHRGWDFPAGRWVPVWFGIAKEPLGHVVLLAPDGSVFSTSDNSTVPHHHPNLADLMNYYAAADLPLTYRGWTEDIEGVTVVDLGSASMGYDGEITEPTEEDDMYTDADRARDVQAAKDAAAVKAAMFDGGTSMPEGKPLKDLVQDSFSAVRAQLATIGGTLATAPGGDVQADAEAIAKALAPDLAKALLVELSKEGE